MPSHTPIGEILERMGHLREETLHTILKRSHKQRLKVGERLIVAKVISGHILYKALAKQRNLAFVNLFNVPPQNGILSNLLVQDYTKHLALPWRQDDDGTIAIACVHPNTATRKWAEERFGKKLRYVMTAPRDIYYAIESGFGVHIEQEARYALLRELPLISAQSGTTPAQKTVSFSLFMLLVFSISIAPTTSLTIVLLIINLFYAMHLAFKGVLFFVGLNKQLWIKAQEPAPLESDRLPTYTILVPLHDEARSIPHLLTSLGDINYPVDKLDIKLIIEEDDEATFDAIKTYKPLPHYHVVKVPNLGNLRTKPRACNYALSFARGELMTIYDAEDRPELEQLRRVAALFASSPRNVACIQCKLNFYNIEEHWLARLFAIEYSQLFDTYLPALQSLNMPIPLGGTSNHMHVKRLKSLGAWDPFNVTEDADLGIRLALLGNHTIILDSLTKEEAPVTIRAWLNQRSRWIKGHMQTWMVYMRQPRKLYRTIGMHGFWGFQLFVGTPSLVYLTAPMMWCTGILWAAGIIPEGVIPSWMLVLNLIILIAGFAGHLWQALVTVRMQGWSNMMGAALTYPLYWFLHSAASFKALYQFIFRPHYWEKTSHGESRFSDFRW